MLCRGPESRREVALCPGWLHGTLDYPGEITLHLRRVRTGSKRVDALGELRMWKHILREPAMPCSSLACLAMLHAPHNCTCPPHKGIPLIHLLIVPFPSLHPCYHDWSRVKCQSNQTLLTSPYTIYCNSFYPRCSYWEDFASLLQTLPPVVSFLLQNGDCDFLWYSGNLYLHHLNPPSIRKHNFPILGGSWKNLQWWSTLMYHTYARSDFKN